MTKVLVIAPHLDDEVLGVGGTIARHGDDGDIVNVCFISNRAYNHVVLDKFVERDRKYAKAAGKILGSNIQRYGNLIDEQLHKSIQEIVILIEECIYTWSPEIVYIPHRGDNNPDHRAVFEAAVVAFRAHAVKGVQKVLCYEVPSSTDQSPPFPEYAFLPNYYVNISGQVMKKISALECYKSEVRKYPHPRSSQGIMVHAQKRGMEIGFNAAEAFILIREKKE